MFRVSFADGEVTQLVETDFPSFLKFAVWQLELGDDTNVLHYQGYMELTAQKTIPQLHLIPGFEGSWFGPRMGTAAQAIAYCEKPDTRVHGPWRYGSSFAQGARTDLMAVKKLIDDGQPMKRVAEEHFTDFIRYERGFKSYKRLQAVKREWAMSIIIYVGPTGTGKSKAARETYPLAYWKPAGKWWDGYDGEETVVIDEMYGHCFPYTELLHLMDRYPHSVETKGGTVEFNSRRIIFTSNEEPEDWYNGERIHQSDWASSPLNRRIKEFGVIIRTGEVHRRVIPVLVNPILYGQPQ